MVPRKMEGALGPWPTVETLQEALHEVLETQRNVSCLLLHFAASARLFAACTISLATDSGWDT